MFGEYNNGEYSVILIVTVCVYCLQHNWIVFSHKYLSKSSQFAENICMATTC